MLGATSAGAQDGQPASSVVHATALAPGVMETGASSQLWRCRARVRLYLNCDGLFQTTVKCGSYAGPARSTWALSHRHNTSAWSTDFRTSTRCNVMLPTPHHRVRVKADCKFVNHAFQSRTVNTACTRGCISARLLHVDIMPSLAPCIFMRVNTIIPKLKEAMKLYF